MAEAQLSAGKIAQFGRDGYVIVRAQADRRLCGTMKGYRAQDHVAREVPAGRVRSGSGLPRRSTIAHRGGGRTVRRLLQACSCEPLFRQWAALGAASRLPCAAAGRAEL